MSRRSALIPRPDLKPMTPSEIETAGLDDKRAEAFFLSVTGSTQKSLAERFHVSTTTIRNWIETYARDRRTRAENVELETERLAGLVEAIAFRAWQRSEEQADGSMAGPSYMKNSLEAVQILMRLRHIDAGPGSAAGPAVGTRTTQVFVTFGRETPERAAIDVGVVED